MFMNKSLISVALAAVWLAGCAPSQQDEGTDQVQVSARALDGYVMRGIVYADLNENGKMDFYESPDKASTDTKGYAGYNAVDSKDYCAATATETEAARCLKVSSGVSEVVLRVTGGYNKSTGVEFVGTLSAKVPVGGSATQPNTISPITSVMVGMDSTAAAAFATTEGLTVADLKSDYLDLTSTHTEPNRRALLAMGMQLHKTADVLFATLNGDTSSVATTDFNGAFGEESGLVTDGTPYAYEVIAANLGSSTVSTVLNSGTFVGDIVDDLVTQMNSKVIDLQSGSVSTINVSTVKTNIVNKVTTLAGFIDDIFSTALTTATANDQELDILGRVRAVEVVTILLRTNNVTATSVIKAIAAATTDGDSATYLANLSNPKFSMTSVVDKFESNTYVDATSVDFSARAALDLSSALTVSDGTSTIGLDFTEGTEAGAGVFTLDPGTLNLGSEIDLAGQTLGGTYEQVDDYTTIMTVEIAPGITQDYVVTTNDDGTGYLIDIGGELVPWNP